MFLFKTSGQTFDSVIANQKHAFASRPTDWNPGEWVLVSKNRADCGSREKQIQYLMVLESIRTLDPGESDRYWPGTEGRWRHLVLCRDTRRISRPFDLKEALGDSAKEYSAVMTFQRLRPDHEAEVRAVLKHREPDLLP